MSNSMLAETELFVRRRYLGLRYASGRSESMPALPGGPGKNDCAFCIVALFLAVGGLLDTAWGEANAMRLLPAGVSALLVVIAARRQRFHMATWSALAARARRAALVGSL